MELDRSPLEFDLRPFLVPAGLNKNRPNRGGSYFSYNLQRKTYDYYAISNAKDEDEERLLHTLYGSVDEIGFRLVDPNSQLSYMNELWEETNRLFLDLESQDPNSVLTGEKCDQIIKTMVLKCIMVFDTRGAEFCSQNHSLQFSYVKLRQFWFRDNTCYTVEGKYHVIFPFLIMPRKVMEKLIKLVFEEENPELTKFVDFKNLNNPKLRMPYMLARDKEGNIKHNNAFYKFNPKSWRWGETLKRVKGSHEIVFRKENRKQKIPEYKINLEGSNLSECLIHLCTIRAHPKQDKERWQARVRAEFGELFGILRAESMNRQRRRILHKQMQRHDFFEQPEDVFNFDKLLEHLEDRGYDEDDSANRTDIIELLVDFCNRYWTVITKDGGKVIIAEKSSRWNNGRPEVYFDIKRPPDFYLKHANKKLWMNGKKNKKGEETDPKDQCIAKLWFEHANRSEHDKITYNPFPVGHPKAVREEVLNCFSNSIIRGKQLLNRDGTPKYSRDDALPWLDLLWRVLGKNDKEFYYAKRWFAHKYNEPHQKMGIILCWFGPQGVGKTELIRVYGHMFGSNYLYNNDINMLFTGNGASSLMENKLVVYLDEAMKAKDPGRIAALKGWTTNTGCTLCIRQMYKDGFMCENCLDFIMSSNEKNAFPKDPGDRRHHLQKCCSPYKFAGDEKLAYWKQWIHWVEDEDFAGPSKVAAYLGSDEVKEDLRTSRFGPFMPVSNDVEDSDQQDLTMTSAQIYVKDLMFTGVNKTFRSKEDWKTVTQMAGNVRGANLFNTGEKLDLQQRTVRLTEEELLEKWVKVDEAGRPTMGAGVKNMSYLEDVWSSYASAWVQYLSQQDIHDDYKRWCKEKGISYPCSWHTLKEVLKEAGIGKFDHPERYRVKNWRWRNEEQQKAKKKSKKQPAVVDPDNQEAPTVQCVVYKFYQFGKAKKNALKWLAGTEKKSEPEKFPDWPLSVLKRHHVPYFMWDTSADRAKPTVSDNNNHQPSPDEDDYLQQSQEFQAETMLCTKCKREMTVYPGKSMIENDKGEAFCSEKCKSVHGKQSEQDMGARFEQCFFGARCGNNRIVVSPGYTYIREYGNLTWYFCSKNCMDMYDEDAPYQSPEEDSESEDEED